MQLRRDLARRLRRDETEAEHSLWMRVLARQLGVKFHRQYQLGRYITDFCCLERLLGKLCISSPAGRDARPTSTF